MSRQERLNVNHNLAYFLNACLISATSACFLILQDEAHLVSTTRWEHKYFLILFIDGLTPN